jgi:S1-C subfamily serine protease
VPFEVRDVSVDEPAAREMVRRTRQMGVPVIADEQEAIVGFDLPRLQRMAARHRKGPGLGLKVANASNGPGVYVGGIREGSPGELAGLEVGDTIVELSGRPVNTVADLEQIAAKRAAGQPTSLTIRRAGELKTLILR